jgi:L-amino acid N-acyltransferase YncA
MTPSIIFRPLKKQDIASCLNMVARNYPNEKNAADQARPELLAMFDSKVAQPFYIVAERDGELVGFGGYAQSWMEYRVYELFWVNIKLEEQGKGYGTKLIDKLVDAIQQFDPKATCVVLTARRIPFYKRVGFFSGPLLSDGRNLMFRVL